MKFLLNLFRSNKISEDRAATLDHVPVKKRKERDWRDAAVKKAAARHGRQFRSHAKVERAEPPSRTLLELNEKSAKPQAPTSVSVLKRGRA